MSIRIMSSVWADHELTDQSELLVMLVIADYSNDDGIAWPSVESIATKSRLYPRSIFRILNRLVKKGKLKIESGGGHHITNRYFPLPLTPDPGTPVTQRTLSLSAKNPDPDDKNPVFGGPPKTPDPSVSIKDPKKIHQNGNGFPENLNTEAFKAAWASWIDHRVEIKKKLTPTSTLHQLRNLSKMGEAKAIEVIEFTISKGWQGLADPQGVFPSRYSQSGAPHSGREEECRQLNRDGN